MDLDSLEHYNPSWMTIYTLGHSTRQLDELVDILEQFDIRFLADVRSIPQSRYNPQFNSDSFSEQLKKHGITYRHIAELGGLRHTRNDSPNTGWRNAAFRGYADYMQTDDFNRAVDDLLDKAAETTTAVMCAEAVPWRCHRTLLSDALLVRDVEVVHILDKNQTRPATLTDFAEVNGTDITYPSDANDQQHLLE